MYADWVMFVPANGDGSRVSSLGPKPFIRVAGYMAIDRVCSMAPMGFTTEIALRNGTPLPCSFGDTIVHFMDETDGQANTIYKWLQRTRPTRFVLISNCDNWIDGRSIEIGKAYIERGIEHAVVFTFRPLDNDDKRFSYIGGRQPGGGWVCKEREVISTNACAGVYMFRWDTLNDALMPDDIHLSQAISRMHKVHVIRVRDYMGFGDMEQISEVERNIAQYRKD